MERLASVQAKFDENVLDATNAWSRVVGDEAELSGLPAMIIERARAAAQAAGLPGWLLPLDAPNYQAVLTHCDNEPLRREFYEAWVTRASDQGPHAGKWNNTPLMGEILALRHEAANLAGFANFAEYSLATKMARDPDEVLEFLRQLARLSRPAAEREFQELESFAGRRLEAWDVGYYSEQLKRARLEVSEEELRPYFPLPRVLAGLFAVASRLYRIRIVARSDVPGLSPGRPVFRHPRPRWHAARRLLSRPVRASQQAQRRMDGRMRRTPAGRAGARAAHRLPGLQLRAAGR